MKGSAATLALFAALCLAWPASAGDGRFGWRALGFEDFRAPVPGIESRRHGGGIESAMALVSIEREVSFLVNGDGGISRIRLAFTGLFDPDRAWFDRTRLPPEGQAALLRHEQGHFDLNEIAVRGLTANAGRIAGEMEAAINADPQKRRQLARLTAEISRLEEAGAPPARRQALAGERMALIESASPTLQRLLAEATAAQDRYDDETAHGSRAEKQAEWDAFIRARLPPP